MEEPKALEAASQLFWLWEYAVVFFLRPLLAVIFILFLTFFSWFVAWKTVLVHVPLVQEIFGLRKKIVKPKPASRHSLSRYYNSISARSVSYPIIVL
ncbi:hypothetical protein KSP39_PZI014566 [Platanthera zijinensis]|uniref:Uncharacterized protein n=1 Tax=Platanthera zijinensis TaxID=2320716 RepID=A0AAP0BAR3_9ASPA